MAEYTVKAPDGKTITLQGPDGASQDEIIAQAQKLYRPTVASGPDAALKNARPNRYKPASVPAPATNQYLEKYNAIRSRLAAGEKTEEARQYALSRFDADPRAQKLRALAGLAPLSTRQGDVRAVAKKAMRDESRSKPLASGLDVIIPGLGTLLKTLAPDTIEAAQAGMEQSVFDLPTRLRGLFGKGFKKEQEENRRLQAQNPVAGLTGNVGGSIGLGTGIGAGVRLTGAKLLPYAPRAANVLQNLTTLRKGQKLANTAKIVATGAAAGGAQAAGEGNNVVAGAATGAVAAPALVGGVKVAQVITRPFRDVLRLSSAGQILSRLTTATRDQLERRAATYRAATGAEPTLFELLPLADRNKILKQAVVGKDNIVEQTSNAIRARARNLGPEMSARARAVLQPNRDAIENGLRADIARARGGSLAPGDDDLIARAMDSPTDMSELRDIEARAIMEPHEATPVVANLEDLFPAVPGPGGTRMSVDPEVATVIRSAAGTLRARAAGAGVTAGDITDMISTLRGDLGKGGIEGRNAQRAIDHLQNILDTQAPDAGAAARQMSDAYAARSRMIEGMQEGNATRLRDDVQVGTSRRQARTVRNAYDTPEGEAGRALGQGNRIQTDLGGAPEEALRATVKQSRGSTGRQLSQNVGPVEADLIAAAARAQDESAQALAAASQKAQAGSGDSADAETLVQAIAGLHPSSFITTKTGAVRRLLDMTYIPESRARTMIDMLFSQDPALMQRALRAIGDEPNGAKFVKYLSGIVGQHAASAVGALGKPGVAEEPESTSAVPSVETDLAAAEQPVEGDQAQMPPVDPADSPYAPMLQQIYANESPELIDLIQRVKRQEHGVDANGNFLTSPAGAVGPMQVMPETAPEAAMLAGLPFDENAYRSDPAYNELLGIAYLSELLRKYNGDVARALAAYNAGPDRTDKALLHGASWLSTLPAETQDYVAKIGA